MNQASSSARLRKSLWLIKSPNIPPRTPGPTKSIGKKFSSVNGQEIGVLVVRNWKTPHAQTDFSLAKVPAYVNVQDYAAITLKEGVPVIREESLGEPFEARFDYQVSLHNPQSAKVQYKLETVFHSTDMPTKTFSKKVTLGGKKGKTLTAASNSSYHKTAANTMIGRVTSADGKTILDRKSVV